MKSRVCALVSGGLDSGVMLAELARRYRQVYPVFLRQGFVWETTELRHLRRFLKTITPPLHRSITPLTVLTLCVRDLYGQHWSITGKRVPNARTPDPAVYLPGRNLLLLSKAAVFCARNRIPVIALGSLGHNPFADATPRFFHDFARAAGEALGCRLTIIAPLRSSTKARVVRRGHDLPLHATFSCLAPKRGRHCGHCNKCAERKHAFRTAGMVDRTVYSNRGR